MSCWFKVRPCHGMFIRHRAAFVYPAEKRCALYSVLRPVRDVQDVPKEQSHAPFVNHWAACQMCTESIPPRVADGGADNKWCGVQYLSWSFIVSMYSVYRQVDYVLLAS
jgi:hypothetical protein